MIKDKEYCGQVTSTSGAMLPALQLFSGWQPGIGDPEEESESKNTGKVKKNNSDVAKIVKRFCLLFFSLQCTMQKLKNGVKSGQL